MYHNNLGTVLIVIFFISTEGKLNNIGFKAPDMYVIIF